MSGRWNEITPVVRRMRMYADEWLEDFEEGSTHARLGLWMPGSSWVWQSTLVQYTRTC
jgi:hypothetical protein